MSDPYAHLPYRPCAGIMLRNADGMIFVGQRLDNVVEAWQMPQGGIDEGEEPITAAIRELGEEAGESSGRAKSSANCGSGSRRSA